MPNNPTPYPEIARKRIVSGQSQGYLERVVSGEEPPDSVRVQAARILLGKVLPDMKHIEATVDATLNVAVTAYDSGHTDPE